MGTCHIFNVKIHTVYDVSMLRYILSVCSVSVSVCTLLGCSVSVSMYILSVCGVSVSGCTLSVCGVSVSGCTVSVWCFSVRPYIVNVWCFSVRLYSQCVVFQCQAVQSVCGVSVSGCTLSMCGVSVSGCTVSVWCFSVRMYTVSVWCFSVRLYSQCVVFQCQVGLVSSPDLMNMVKAYTTESNYTVWSDLLSDMSEMGRLLQYTDAATHFQNFVCDLLQAIYADLGWENMNPDEEGNTRLFIFMTANKCFLFFEICYCFGIACGQMLLS